MAKDRNRTWLTYPLSNRTFCTRLHHLVTNWCSS